MPELPDLTLYVDALEARLGGAVLREIRIRNPFLLRSVAPAPDVLCGRRVAGVSRMGKRLVVGLEGDLHAVIHLMIAGRLQWRAAGCAVPARVGLAAFDFDCGSLLLTEAGRKRRASLHLIEGQAALRALDAGGLEVLGCTPEALRAALAVRNHTVKRALTDPRMVAGIGNAYSDEILHRARISPMRQTRLFDDAEWGRLYEATQAVLAEWTERLRKATGDGFPAKVSAFHPQMAVHGRYGLPCPDCGKPVQRIRYTDNECNYCAQCQNQGNLLADRGLSRLLHKDWPRTLEELEQR